ncbi:SDR family oxidoreductase [Mycolicibacterium obuense]|uniref:3-oxoacyl-[acyl-carrier-protein] reductase FabG n=1 Tax=Mycolicibacterium obuense TaxID=1807 RepID=A0A0J6VB87_9MYCO|nr:SDR family oxidoreductase [Mycolicibacterium obuense]KMO68175.1 3-oxoacyl-[acyl-carrier-protein] reductase FabG [Mycolicibacterium obuense]
MTALAGQAVLVTGANRGMGREYVAQLLDRGVSKVYAAARDPQTIDHDDARVIALPLDVTDPASIAAAAEVATDVGVLINNAGILRGASVLEKDITAMREELEANLFGPLMMAATFADRIAERAGAIVNVSSVLAWVPGGSYGVSKAALWSATNAMRTELTPRGVQVMGVYVGLVDTDMAAFAPDSAKSRPEDVIRQVLDGIESGAAEVLADDMTRQVRAELSASIT